MGVGFSHYTWSGWKGQFERVQRWWAKVRNLGGKITKEEDMDVVYAFFQNCYHLRDWLKNSGKVNPTQLDNFFKKNKEMQVCRAICDGTKHWRLDKPHVDSEPSIGREYWTEDYQPWFVIAGGEKYDLFELGERCMKLWDDFLKVNKLV